MLNFLAAFLTDPVLFLGSCFISNPYGLCALWAYHLNVRGVKTGRHFDSLTFLALAASSDMFFVDIHSFYHNFDLARKNIQDFTRTSPVLTRYH